MYFWIGEDKEIMQKFGVLVSDKRIVPFKSPKKALDDVVKFTERKNKIDLIIASCDLTDFKPNYVVTFKKILDTACKKLSERTGEDIDIYFIGYYKTESEEIKKLKEEHPDIFLFKCDKQDPESGYRFAKLMQEKYKIIIDTTNLRAKWLGEMESLDEIRGMIDEHIKKEGVSLEHKIGDEKAKTVEQKTEEPIDITQIPDVTQLTTQEEYDSLKQEYDNKVKECEEWKKKYENLKNEVDTLKKIIEG